MSFPFRHDAALHRHGHGFHDPDQDGDQGGARAGEPGTVLYNPDAADGDDPATAPAPLIPGTTVATAATAASPFVINIAWDSSVSSAPAGFTSAVLAAAQYLESKITDPVTINIDVGYGEVAGNSLGDALGESESYLAGYSYATLRAAVAADASSAADQAVVASLPMAAPVGGSFWLTTAEAKALGLAPATAPSLDGYIGFSSSVSYTFNDSAGVSAGTYDLNGVALHELTEAMGRMLLTGATVGTTPNSYTLMDLLHYSAPGTRDFAAGTAGYVAADGGTTSLGALNADAGGDPGDWSSSVASDAFDAFSASGVVNAMTSGDLSVMDAIGWNLANTSAPTGLVVSAVPAGLQAAQTGSGLAPNAVIAAVGQTGGAPADSYAYALAGPSSALFTLSSSGTLAVGSAGLAGATGGRLLSVSVTPIDTTSGHAGPSSPIGIIVGSGAGDSIAAATLSGPSGVATPSLLYGLGGSDTLNGTGMTGKLWFIGGAGSDRMTGGSGVNDYLFGAVSDSTPSAMDIIGNFHTADLIDLTGLGLKLSYLGNLGLPATTLAGDSIGWHVGGGNTYFHVNTSSVPEALKSTDMTIELQGAIAPQTSNIIHL